MKMDLLLFLITARKRNVQFTWSFMDASKDMSLSTQLMLSSQDTIMLLKQMISSSFILRSNQQETILMDVGTSGVIAQ